MANVFRWTGHFPERTRVLLRHLAERAVTCGRATPDRGSRGDRGADDAGHGAGDELRAAGVVFTMIKDGEDGVL